MCNVASATLNSHGSGLLCCKPPEDLVDLDASDYDSRIRPSMLGTTGANMPIQVTCQKCHKRFSVNEKFAGRTGPCPACKTPIKIPEKNEEVVIHAPENLGPKDSTGKAVLAPIEREEVNASPVAIVGIVGAIILAIIAAVALRFVYPQPEDATAVDPTLWWILAAGAIVVAGPIVLAGYWFLRNDELEPYRGGELALRVSICAAVYALLWGAYALLKVQIFKGAEPPMFAFAAIGPAIGGIGALVSLATLDFDFTTGIIHYAFYLLVTVLFCFVIGVPAY